LREQSTLIDSLENYIAWEQQCDTYIESLEEQSRIKRPRLSIGNRQSLIARIARLEGLKNSVRERFVHAGAGCNARQNGLGVRLIRSRVAYRLVR